MRKSLLLLLLAVAIAVPMQARGKKQQTSTEPGKYKEWGPDIDEIEILKSFKLDDYKEIIIEPFTSEGVKLPDKDDNSYDSARRALAESPEYLAGGLNGLLDQKIYLLDEGDKEPTKSGTLLLRAKVTEMDPGSRAARYWVGFGAGAARTEIQGELVDAKTGEVLLRFTQQRRSGVGAYGGDYQELMRRNLNTIGEDVAHMLREF